MRRLRIILRLAWLLLWLPWAAPESVVAWLADTEPWEEDAGNGC